MSCDNEGCKSHSSRKENEDESFTFHRCPCFNEEGALLGIGNPLLDISANVGEDLLKKYDLDPNGAIMAEEKHMPLYEQLMTQYKTEFIAGGSVQNSLRVAQWILKKPKVCNYYGCVGDDEYASILKQRAIADGVNVRYQVSTTHPTGTCAVLITGIHRSLCANLAAAQQFVESYLHTEEAKRDIEAAKVFYSSGFFLAVSLESLMVLASHSHAKGLTFAFNISAAFVSQFYKDRLIALLPYVDVFFGNEMEAEAFATAFNFETTDKQQIAQKIAALPKLNEKKPRVVVITQGCNSVILCENGKLKLVPVIPLTEEEIVDTNGAGDGFTGGFLAQLVQGKSMEVAVKCGIYAASQIIQASGCTFSGPSKFKSS